MDFTTSFFFDYRCILARRGMPEVDPWSFIYVLATPVWVGLLLAGLAVWTAAMLLVPGPSGISHRRRSAKTLFRQVQVILNQGG